MAKYLIEGHYTAEGAKAIARDGGAARRAGAALAIPGRPKLDPRWHPGW